MTETLIRRSYYDLFIRAFLYLIVVGNVVILSVVFLRPRLVFMVKHWGASEREILLSEGPRDNPTMEHLRKFYTMMYLVKDHSEENSILYFVNRKYFPNEVYKILLINYLDNKARSRLNNTW